MAEKDEFFLPEDIDRQIEDVKQSKEGDQSDAEALIYLSSYYQADTSHQQEALDRIWNRIANAPLLQQNIQESRKKRPMQNSQNYTPIEAMGGLRGARSPRHSLFHRLNTLVAAVLLVALLGGMAAVLYTIRQHAGTSSPNPVITTAHGCTTAANCQKAIVTVAPNQVKPGGKVTVTGKGWVANAKLQASIGTQALDSNIVSATSDARGNFSVTLTINQPTDIGPTTIHINLANTKDVSKNLTVQGKLTIIQSTGGCTTAANCQKAIVTVAPNQVKPGDKVTVTGKGWVANARLQASIGTQAVDSNIVSATSDAQGNFSVILTIDPQTPDFGPTTIHINLAGTTDGSKNLTVQGKLTIIQGTGGCTTAASCQGATVTVTPNQVKPGDKVTVTGNGWVANAQLQASIGTQAVDSNIVSATSDAQGNFSVTLTIDPQTPDFGPTTIHINLANTADGSKNLTVQGKLTIIQGTGGCTTAASCQNAIVTVTPNQVKAGGKVTVTGTGWVANAQLQASIGTQAVDSNIVSATSDAQGNFSVTLTIDPRTTDIGPTTIHLNDTTDGSKNLTVQGKLTIIK